MRRRVRERQERKQATDFKETACCFSAVVQGAAKEKKWFVCGEFPDNWDPREGQQQFDPNQTGSGIATPR